MKTQNEKSPSDMANDSSVYTVQHQHGANWINRLDMPNLDTAKQVCDHLNGVKKRKHRVVKIDVQVLHG